MVSSSRVTEYVIYFIGFLLPIVAMPSGQAIAPLGLISLIIFLYSCKKLINLSFTKNSKLELSLIIWIILTCLWSTAPLKNLVHAIMMGIIIIIAYLSSICALNTENINRRKLTDLTALSCIIASLFFAIEAYSGGIIEKSFGRNEFHLFMLNRGVSFISLLMWPIIGFYLQIGHKTRALGLYLIVCMTLCLSDSLAAGVGVIFGSITFLLMYFSKSRLWPLLALGLLFYSIIMPVTFYYADPYILSERFSFLPFSAKHRMFIWHYTAEHIIQSPWVGLGHDFSRVLSKQQFIRIHYLGINLNLFPLYPHNNIMQIFLELGAVGMGICFLLAYKYLHSIRTMINHMNNAWGAAAYAFFVAYISIGAISFGIWQSWWLVTLIYIAFLTCTLRPR